MLRVFGFTDPSWLWLSQVIHGSCYAEDKADDGGEVVDVLGQVQVDVLRMNVYTVYRASFVYITS